MVGASDRCQGCGDLSAAVTVEDGVRRQELHQALEIAVCAGLDELPPSIARLWPGPLQIAGRFSSTRASARLTSWRQPGSDLPRISAISSYG